MTDHCQLFVEDRVLAEDMFCDVLKNFLELQQTDRIIRTNVMGVSARDS